MVHNEAELLRENWIREQNRANANAGVIEFLEKRITQLQGEVESLHSQLDAVFEENQALKNHLSDASRGYGEKWKIKAFEAREERNDLRVKLQQAEQERDSLKSQLAWIEQDRDRYKTRFRIRHKMAREYYQEMKEEKERADDANCKIVGLWKEIDTRDQANTAMREAIAEAMNKEWELAGEPTPVYVILHGILSRYTEGTGELPDDPAPLQDRLEAARAEVRRLEVEEARESGAWLTGRHKEREEIGLGKAED